MAQSKLQNTDNPYQGSYPSVFKKIDTTDVQVNPFQSYKTWTVYSGSLTSSILPLQGVYTDVNFLPAIGSTLTFNDAANVNGSLQSITYFSINHLFYKYKDQPYNTFGPTNLNRTKKFLFQTASIFSIPLNKIGQGIKPASFSFTSSVSGSFSSDRYGNIIDTAFNTASIISQVKLYEGFNEYFDTNRISYISNNVTYIPGVPTTNGQQRNVGLAAKFTGSSYIETSLDGYYDRDHDYAISFFISSSNNGSSNQLIFTKASSSLDPVYPFKIELSGSKQLLFSAAGATNFVAQISSSTAVSSSWTHIVCQKTGSSLHMYVNGTLQSSVSSTLLSVYDSPYTASARIDNNHNLKIGGYNSITANLNGLIDEIRIYNKSLTSTEIGYLTDRTEGGTFLQTNQVGNVFEKQGLIVFSSPDYRIHDLIKTPFTASYKSTVSIYEMSVVAKLDAGDFNMSTNLTLTKDDDSTYYPFVSSSAFAPYITTIGLYDDAGQLLAIGKLAQPIKKRSDVDMNFLIRLDLDNNVVFKG
jgi:hypothetical protein